MRKAADAFRSIGEVSHLVGVPPHVLRYWETQFPQLAPVKRADGRRYYRPEDLHLAAGLCELLREEGMTTRGAARMIARDKGAALRARGLARLPERFRGEAEGQVEEGVVEAEAGEAAPSETLASESSDSAKEPAKPPAPAPVPDAEPQREDAIADGDCESVAATLAQPGPLAAPAEIEGTTMTTPEAEAPAAPEAAAEAPATEGPPPEAATLGDPAEEAPASDAHRTEAPLAQAPMIEAPAAPDPQVPAPAAAVSEAAASRGEASPATPAPSEEVSAEAVPARRPAPTAADLPLFPGLAPSAPPPGIWLPRLAATADALRAMTPPRRPPAQLQWLRDRLAAIIDPGA